MKHIGQHADRDRRQHGRLVGRSPLSDFYAVVTVLERDTFSAVGYSARGRAAGPPCRHGLLARGRNVIEAFFPGWTDEVVAGGGARGDIPQAT